MHFSMAPRVSEQVNGGRLKSHRENDKVKKYVQILFACMDAKASQKKS